MDINGRVHNEIYISVIVHELFAQSNHRSMAKLLILAALLFLSSKTGVSSVGTTTSPQQQNPQTGADKDPCEVLLSILYPQLFTIKLHVLHNAFICHTSVYHSCPPSSAKNKSLINHKFSNVENYQTKFSFRDISTRL